MPYVVTTSSVYRKRREPEWRALLSGPQPLDAFEPEIPRKRPVSFVRFTQQKSPVAQNESDDKMLTLFHLCDDMEAAKKLQCKILGTRTYPRYQVLHIPKRSGGTRIILSQQNSWWKRMQRKTAYEILRLVGGTHCAAYAFVKGRSAKSAMEQHKKNASRWFLKMDIRDFFHSTDLDAAIDILRMISPFDAEDYVYMRIFLNYLFPADPEESPRINHITGLPELVKRMHQGLPSSPILSNVLMIPFDTEFYRWCKEKSLVYTRYADDILVSGRTTFDWQEVRDKVRSLFSELGYPYALNEKKTRYGSSSGKNWNLGMMLNKENDLTPGWQKKKALKSEVAHFCLDAKEGIVPKEELRLRAIRLRGRIAWFEQIQPGCTENALAKAEAKFGVRLRDWL